MGEERNGYRDQVKRVMAMAGTGGNNDGEKEHNVSAILWFSGSNRRALRGWMGQLAMKIADEPKRFTNKQKKMRYPATRLKGMALNQIKIDINKPSGN
jgi:hypothetical protein